MCVTFTTHLFILHLITLYYLEKATNYEDPHYAVFSSLMLLPPFSVQIFSSAPFSQTPSTVSHNVSETKFHTPTKQQVKSKVFCFNLWISSLEMER
jgi:hypothetical protein